jgi:hypothetical protein
MYFPMIASESRLPAAFFFHGSGMVQGNTEISDTFHSNVGISSTHKAEQHQLTGNHLASKDCFGTALWG